MPKPLNSSNFITSNLIKMFRNNVLMTLMTLILLSPIFLANLVRSASANIFSSLNLTQVGLYATSYFQGVGANSNSAFIFWSPSLQLHEKWHAFTDLGGSVLNTPDQKFLVWHLAERLKYTLLPEVGLEFTLGAQNWISAGGLLLMGGTGLSFDFNRPSLIPYLKTIRGAVNYVSKLDDPAIQCLLGLEFSLEPFAKIVQAEAPVIPLEKPQEMAKVIAPAIAEPPKGQPFVPIFKSTPWLVLNGNSLEIILPSMKLGFNSAVAKLGRKSHNYLKNIAKIFRNNQHWERLTIAGHADSSGHAERHQNLSSRRAIAVYSFLRKVGLDSSKMSIRGASSEEPMADNKSDDGKTLNRRAEIWVTIDPHHVDELTTQLLTLTEPRPFNSKRH